MSVPKKHKKTVFTNIYRYKDNFIIVGINIRRHACVKQAIMTGKKAQFDIPLCATEWWEVKVLICLKKCLSFGWSGKEFWKRNSNVHQGGKHDFHT